MTDHTSLLLFATVLVALDLLTALFLVSLYRRMLVVESSLLARGKDLPCQMACAANVAVIAKLENMVARNSLEIAQVRDVGNANQTEIMAAIHAIHDQVLSAIEARIMPRATLEAALRDLYNRTQERDPDAAGRLDADVLP